MKTLILTMLLFCGTVFAGDSGTYHNPERSGEGIVLQRNGDIVVTYLFTYGQEICGLPIPPIVSPEPEVLPDDCQLIGQRWFFGVDNIVGNVVSGVLYKTDGANGANGVVGTETAVGTYTLVRDGDGWLMAVDKFGPELAADDPLFAEIYDFTSALFRAED